MYIELKSGFSDNGPAWIGKVEFSKTGQTIYFDNKALKRIKNGGINSNYYNIETGEDYWVSGIKQNGQDRHWAGGGKVMIDKNSIPEYLDLLNLVELNAEKFVVVEFSNTDKERFRNIENTPLTDEQYAENMREYWDKNSKKFELRR